MKEITNDEREKLEQEFWSAVTDIYPEVESGDLPPEVVMHFEQTIEEVVNTWLRYNHPDNREEDEEDF